LGVGGYPGLVRRCTAVVRNDSGPEDPQEKKAPADWKSGREANGGNERRTEPLEIAGQLQKRWHDLEYRPTELLDQQRNVKHF